MINNCMNVLLNGAKTLLGKKSTQDILRYLGTVTISHLANKYKVNKYKYDPIDLKNMVYHHNMNNDCKINKENIDQMIDIMNINRFAQDIMVNKQVNYDPMNEMISKLLKVLNDEKITDVYNDMIRNNVIQQFDTDTIETSAIADNYEISSGGIYLPNDNAYTSTIEGCNLANAKNDYLTKRLELGENASKEEINGILNEYYDKIDFDKVLKYFNK